MVVPSAFQYQNHGGIVHAHKLLSKLQFQIFIDALESDFVCQPNTFIAIVSGATLSGILTLFILLLIPVYKYRGEIKIMLYMRFHWRLFDTADDTDIIGQVSRLLHAIFFYTW